MGRSKNFTFPFIQALMLHLGIFALFAMSFFSTETTEKKIKPLPEIIQASILDENKVQEEAERQKQQTITKRQNEQKRKQLLEQELHKEQQRIKQLKEQRIAEERDAKEKAEQRKQEEVREKQKLANLKKQAEEAERQAKLKEKKRKAAEERAQKEEKKRKEAEVKAREEEKRKKEAAEKAQAEEQKQEAERQAAAQREQEAEAERLAEVARQKATQDQIAMTTIIGAISGKVKRNWIRPPTAKKGQQCTIQVKLLSSGEVMQAVVSKSSGDPVFDRSAEIAVRKASPFSEISSDRELYNRAFKSFTFVFKPE